MRLRIAVAMGTAAALGALIASPANAATITTQGTGWKLTTDFGVTSASPTKTYTVTYESETVRKWYAPMIQRAVDQINASTELNIAIGGVEPMSTSECGPDFHIQVMERKDPLGADKPGWSQAMPCPNPPNGMGVGGPVVMNSNYRDGSWNITQQHLQNTAVHEMLHTLGLDHPNTDIDTDGTVESGECVATSYGNRPIMCSPNGGYGSWQNVGKLVGYDINGINALINNAKTQGLS